MPGPLGVLIPGGVRPGAKEFKEPIGPPAPPPPARLPIMASMNCRCSSAPQAGCVATAGSFGTEGLVLEDRDSFGRGICDVSSPSKSAAAGEPLTEEETGGSMRGRPVQGKVQWKVSRSVHIYHHTEPRLPLLGR